MHISQAILGMTVLAWGNSVSDMVADVVVARKGLQGMAVAATFAGPLFSILTFSH
jgi:sodium/potassium/calcium exchanger 6